jgi:hypothetical protein
MSLDTELRDLLGERLDAVVPPPGDIAGAVRRGGHLRRRRRLLTGVAGVAGAVATVAVVAAGVSLLDNTDAGPRGDRGVDTLGQLDFSHGLRAYADPGHTLHIGGRTVPAAGLDFLDTDAVATSEGVVYYAGGDLRLVQEDGTTTTLDGGDRTPARFHPTAKADGASPLVAYAVVVDGKTTLRVLDMGSREVVASRVLDCTGACGGLVVDGIDSGAVFVRTKDGTSVWRYADGQALTPFAGPDTSVADARNGVVLYAGPAPGGEAAGDWTLVPGAIDAQLTYDGRYVLYWSSRLTPTDPADGPVTLDQGPAEGSGFWSIDTDGTVLVAAPNGVDGAEPGYTVYDCEVPSGACEELGPLDPQGGDPAFIGNDM